MEVSFKALLVLEILVGIESNLDFFVSFDIVVSVDERIDLGIE